MNNWYLHNATRFDRGELKTGDVGIVGGRFADPEVAAAVPAVQHLDVSEYLISPGFVDLHTHLREPGAPNKETLATAAAAAARGGFTQITAMPNTLPTIDSAEAVQELSLRLQSLPIKVSIAGAATNGRLGREPVAFAALKELGVWLFTDDGDPIGTKTMGEVMRLAAEANVTVANHLEDQTYHSPGTFSQSIPAESEWRMLERDLELVAKTNCRYHAQHLSCAQSAALMARAKQAKLPVSSEVTPHHLVLSSEQIGEPRGHYQMKPPLRTPEDREALVNGLAAGTIDCIATDHAPHGKEKEGAWIEAMPFGVTGLETAFPVLYTDLVLRADLSLERLLDAMTYGPAAIGGWTLSWEWGRQADLVILDLHRSHEVRTDEFLSLGTNSPFVGRVLEGWPLHTLSAGREVWTWK